MAATERVMAIMARLRDPVQGCPWDVAQDFASIAPHTIEEAYEVADAIDQGDFDDLRDELADLLLQVVYHARMAEEAGAFDFEAVATTLADKLVRRHPHVFADREITDSDTRERRWEETKAAERAARGDADTSALAGVTQGLPAATRAQKLGRRASRVGFDWPEAGGAVAKVREELAEVEAAGDDPAAREAEIGDLLFASINLARHLDVDAETALRRAGARFERRFRAVEQRLAATDRVPASASLAELEAEWQAVKAHE